MSIPLSDVDESTAQLADETALLTRRVHAVRQVSAMASGGAVRLLEHTRQLEATLDRLTGQFESLPDAARLSLVTERMGSMQAMLDWLTTRSVPDGNPPGFSGLQTRLSMSRAALADIQSEIQRAGILACGLQATRVAVCGLIDEIEMLEFTQAKAEALLLESRELSARMELETETSVDINDSG